MDSECIFCKIAGGEIPATPVYRSTDVIAIEDINPQAPAHLLVMPVRHYANLAELVASVDGKVIDKLFDVAVKLGRDRGGAGGYRLVVNTGTDGGQTVDHVHVHVLAGRPMTWPPG